MTVQSQTPTELVKNVYSNLEGRLSAGREALGRPLTLAEKILINHSLQILETLVLEH